MLYSPWKSPAARSTNTHPLFSTHGLRSSSTFLVAHLGSSSPLPTSSASHIIGGLSLLSSPATSSAINRRSAIDRHRVLCSSFRVSGLCTNIGSSTVVPHSTRLSPTLSLDTSTGAWSKVVNFASWAKYSRKECSVGSTVGRFSATSRIVLPLCAWRESWHALLPVVVFHDKNEVVPGETEHGLYLHISSLYGTAVWCRQKFVMTFITFWLGLTLDLDRRKTITQIGGGEREGVRTASRNLHISLQGT